ncbi:DUF4073 domain-containing protein [Bacillus sp. CGMCC 1.16607]|uniref:DUF4073 domain-containing protein n=1 Tax=Bacillus sp. CGMCC 1.16607 TaxID=3351842 RepID=UPI003634A7D4
MRIRKLASFLLVFLLIVQLFPLGGSNGPKKTYAEDFTGGNVAWGKPITASGVYYDSLYAEAIWAVDGKIGDFNSYSWRSEEKMISESNPVWIKIDTKKLHTVYRWVVVGSNQVGAIKDIILEGSNDGVNFQTIDYSYDNLELDKRGFTSIDKSFTPVTYRYFRVKVTESFSTTSKSWAEIFEFELYGQEAIIKLNPPTFTPTTINAVEDTQSNEITISSTEQDVGYYKISDIQGGKLFQKDGVTAITEGQFIPVSQGNSVIKFTPNADANSIKGGIFSFKVQAAVDAAGKGLSEPTTVPITVSEVNDAPTANTDTLDTIGLGAEKITIPLSKLTDNDKTGPINENDQTLSIIDVSGAVGGTVSLEDGQVQFVPTSKFQGIARFNYTIADNGTTNGEADPETAIGKAEFIIQDENKPIITLQGDNPFYSLMNEFYQEPGFAAEDDIDGDLTNEVTVSGLVDTNQLGNYVLKYNVKDSSNNAATEVTRNVQVVSNELKTLVPSFGEVIPVFDPKEENYTLNVPNHITSLDLTAATLDPTATLTMNGQLMGNNGTEAFLLEVGKNTITLVVTAQGGFTKTYTLEVTRDYGTPEKPNVTADDDLNVIVGADDTMEYSPNGIDSWTSYNSNSIPKFPGNEFVWVRVKSVEGQNYASESTKLTFTANIVVPTPIPVPVPTPDPTPMPTPEPTPDSRPEPSDSGTAPGGSKTEIITVDVDGESGKNLNKTPIKRTTETNGSVKDDVIMPENIARDTVKNAKESGNNTARIVIPDVKDIVTETIVKVPITSLNELKSGELRLEIFTENATVSIPKTSLTDFNDDLYFHFIPIKKEAERMEVEERAKKEEVVKKALGNGTIEVVGRPMTIETNLLSRKVDLIMPLLGVTLPDNLKEREIFLNNLGIFIEHSDGERVLVKPEVVTYKDGLQGLKFTIEKFSTFTIVNMEGTKTHTPYIKGFKDGTFRPGAFVKRSEMAAMLARNLPADVVLSNKGNYIDVSTGYWGYGEIMKAKQSGIMTGFSGDKFNPLQEVTRAQMATIAYRWMKNECEKDSNAYKSCSSLDKNSLISYSDVSAGHWAVEAIQFMKEADVMEGFKDNTFHPDEKLTRAQAVKVLNRLFKRGPLNGDIPSTFSDVDSNHWAFKEIEEAGKAHSYTVNHLNDEYIKN